MKSPAISHFLIAKYFIEKVGSRQKTGQFFFCFNTSFKYS